MWLGHERSADVGNGVQWRGREVNHQYDKSGAFLARTRAYLSDTAAETYEASSGSGSGSSGSSGSGNIAGDTIESGLPGTTTAATTAASTVDSTGAGVVALADPTTAVTGTPVGFVGPVGGRRLARRHSLDTVVVCGSDSGTQCTMRSR